MASPEDKERQVFYNDDDDDDDEDEDDTGDDSDLDDEDEFTDEGPPPPPQPTAAPAGDQYLNSSTPSSDRTPNPNPNPNPKPNPVLVPHIGSAQVLPLSSSAAPPDLQLQVIPVPEERRAIVSISDDSRRLFQRLWTDDDEMKILQGFLEFTSQRGTTFASHQYDTGPFYEQIRKQIQIDFSKNQLIEKLRRLKKKFRNAASKISSGKEFAFKSPHDQATFEISRKIWSLNLKRAHDSDDDDLATPTANIDPGNAIAASNGAPTSDRRASRSRRRVRRRIEEAAVEVPVVGVTVEDPIRAIPPSAPAPAPAPAPSIVEETVKSCLEPLFKELLKSSVGVPCGLGLNVGGLPLNALLSLSFGENPLKLPVPGAPVDEKWKKQQIMELEVYSKRIELLQDQIKSTLEELKSSGT